MRILGYLDHPVFKITVFKMDTRLSVKLETSGYEQIYKFREGEGADTLEEVQKLVDGPFLAEVQALFHRMHAARLAAQQRLTPVPGEEEFPHLI